MIIVRIIGGLGNQMFQYALYQNLKNKYPNVKVDIHGYEKYKLHTGFSLENVFNIELDKASLSEIGSVTNLHKPDIFSKISRKVFGNKSTHFKENDFYLEMVDSTNDFYLDGYWQNETYFGDHEQLKLDFIFKQDSDTKNNMETEELIRSCNSVSIHVRRGDYVGNKYYTQLDEEYYKNSMMLIQNQIKDAVFFIFSNDLSWVKENLIPRLQLKANIVFVGNNTSSPHNDMKMMALCKHNIIANSSFSWWGAWLNNKDSKLVVAPKNWFHNPSMNAKHIEHIPNSWIKI